MNFTYTAEGIDTSINYLRALRRVLRCDDQRAAAITNPVEVGFMQTPWPVVAFLHGAQLGVHNRATTIFVASSLAFWLSLSFGRSPQPWPLSSWPPRSRLRGLPVGIWMAKNKYFDGSPNLLDVMQTIPSLSYPVPAVAFFGISQPPRCWLPAPDPANGETDGARHPASARQPKEAALAFGAPTGRFCMVEPPMAIPSISSTKPYAGAPHG